MAKRNPIPEPTVIAEYKYNRRKIASLYAKLEKACDKIEKAKKEANEIKIEIIKNEGFVLESVPRKRRVKGEIIFDEIGYKVWREDFIDEDTGEVVTIDRKAIVFINGKWYL